MKREVFGNLEELTKPDVLSELVQERISAVCLEPFAMRKKKAAGRKTALC